MDLPLTTVEHPKMMVENSKGMGPTSSKRCRSLVLKPLQCLMICTLILHVHSEKAVSACCAVPLMDGCIRGHLHIWYLKSLKNYIGAEITAGWTLFSDFKNYVKISFSEWPIVHKFNILRSSIAEWTSVLDRGHG